MNIFYRRGWEKDKIGFEISNRTGQYGVTNGTENVAASGFAFAIDYQHHNPVSKWSYGLKTGWASGDDPTTADEYEGYAFDQNYDLGLMLFNHSMGQANILKSQLVGTRYPVNGTRFSPEDDVDIEAISNSYYVAPSALYQWSDKWQIRGTLITGWLDQTEIAANIDADAQLGYEFNLSLIMKPNERLVWENTFAYMMTGSAFEVDNTKSVSDGYGIVSRAAISF
jgi:hypothetical protein